ncbi:MAG: DUF4214 domain-containing protein [Opitutales bacterium]|nr:DUF4214 domain-containing protein [Opitutales bacterium]
MRKDWGIIQVREHLQKSTEYRYTTIPKMVKLTYQEVLDREPDPTGERFYLARAREGWTFEQIKNHMRQSDEYRSKRK